jgi:hypothetical protein
MEKNQQPPESRRFQLYSSVVGVVIAGTNHAVILPEAQEIFLSLEFSAD